MRLSQHSEKMKRKEKKVEHVLGASCVARPVAGFLM